MFINPHSCYVSFHVYVVRSAQYERMKHMDINTPELYVLSVYYVCVCPHMHACVCSGLWWVGVD